MTSSVRKQPIRWAFLPSLLAISLALSACQESSVPNQDVAAEDASTVTSNIDSSGATTNGDTLSNVSAIDDDTTVEDMSAEEVMIANLARYRWTLQSATDDNAQPLDILMNIKDQVRLSFNQYQGQNTLNYSVGCNTMSAVYQLEGSALTVEDSMSTKMSCGELDEAENDLSELVQGSSQLVFATAENDATSNDGFEDDRSINNMPILTLVTSDGVTLTWEGKLTAQAKYNSKGDTVFWAVSANRVPCNGDIEQMCLRVKPITYDNQGIKISEGKWRVFIGTIDGYQHDGTHDEVLRLQRYSLDNDKMIEEGTANTENTSDKQYAYVLDAVIQSSVVE